MNKPEPSIFDEADDEADEAAMLRGEADADAGQFMSHEAVSKWLDTWGKPDRPPPPECGE